MNLSVTCDQQKNLEKLTRLQSQSESWFDFRAGRVTASLVYDVCRTSVTQPSKSLLMKICYPLKCRFSSPQTNWGLSKESTALSVYEENCKSKHSEFCVERCGFIVSVDNPRFGASPDSIVSCLCCGRGCIEVKCPYKCKSSLKIEVDYVIGSGTTFQLNPNHRHNYQVQFLMFVLKVSYCDFVVWSPNDIVIIRVPFNVDFCDRFLDKPVDFHENCVMPELLCKYFSQGLKATTPFSVRYCKYSWEYYCCK